MFRFRDHQHFTASDTVRDVVVGMSDGLTVPFALAAGISGAIAVSHLVVTAGLAEIAAGSIAMGLGGYLAGRSESEHYASERRRDSFLMGRRNVCSCPGMLSTRDCYLQQIACSARGAKALGGDQRILACLFIKSLRS